ncbi:MAG: hypothetical protein QNJ16_05520 [Rhodobacter sp.]|nr:hypothetical protein [Rhodobacter sp.]
MDAKYAWSDEKDEVLRKERGFGFADVVAAIDTGFMLDDIAHPGAGFEHQRMMFVLIRGYTIAVPYVTDGKVKFLKTAYHNRQAHRRYMGRDSDGRS